MRTKKALINSITNIISFIIIFIPNLIIRKVFFDSLGSELLGLSSLFANIIGWLSIVELGIGTTITFSLYKPYAENDQAQVRSYIRLYGKFYRAIGVIVLTIGIVITPMLKYLIDSTVNIKLVYIGFLLHLLNSVISYMFSHKICILTVSQMEYKNTILVTSSKLLIIILQLIMFDTYPSFILFIAIQILMNLIYFIFINFYINKEYPWLNNGNEKIPEREKKKLTSNIRAMFMHKIGSSVVYSTDNIVISKFVGLSSLALYTNYQIVISAFQTLITTGMNGITASIGNLLASNDNNKSYDVHKKIFFLSFWIVSFTVISLYNTLNQFIGIWIGKEFLLDNATFNVVIMNLYFVLMRNSVEQFQNGSGNFYQDRYAPVCEAIINLSVSLILVRHIGILGVFIGTLTSNFTVIFWTKPYVVYKYVFRRRLSEYFYMYFKYILIATIPLCITNYLVSNIKYNYMYSSFLLNCIINIIIINLIYVIIFFRNKEFKYFMSILKKIMTNKSKNKVA